MALPIARLTGEQIRLLRNRLGLSQVQFASLFNTTHQTVYRWENGTVPEGPTSAILMALDQGTRDRDTKFLKDALAGVVLAFGLYFLLQAVFASGPTTGSPSVIATAARPQSKQ